MRWLLPILTIVVSTAVLPAAAMAASAPFAGGELDEAGETSVWKEIRNKNAQMKTADDLQKVGKAMLSWAVDHLRGKTSSSWPPADRGDSTTWRATLEASEHRKAVDKSYASISRDVVVELLVPNYLDRVPKKDGWGHPYQYAINDDLLAMAIVAMRSAGADGRFDTDRYEIGPFYALDFDNDMVWGDGYFIRWPSLQTR